MRQFTTPQYMFPPEHLCIGSIRCLFRHLVFYLNTPGLLRKSCVCISLDSFAWFFLLGHLIQSIVVFWNLPTEATPRSSTFTEIFTVSVSLHTQTSGAGKPTVKLIVALRWITWLKPTDFRCTMKVQYYHASTEGIAVADQKCNQYSHFTYLPI
jgi:predicted acetyltransferase